MQGDVKSKPILFNTAMVQAILDGRKTVTRRVIKPQPTTVHPGENHYYIYKANNQATDMTWRPSIHMPKEAARIFLKVTDVRVERLQEIAPVSVIREGLYDDCIECLETYGNNGTQCCYKTDDECHQCDSVMTEFHALWNSTIKKKDLEQFGWDANPWVWVIEFERCENEE